MRRVFALGAVALLATACEFSSSVKHELPDGQTTVTMFSEHVNPIGQNLAATREYNCRPVPVEINAKGILCRRDDGSHSSTPGIAPTVLAVGGGVASSLIMADAMKESASNLRPDQVSISQEGGGASFAEGSVVGGGAVIEEGAVSAAGGAAVIESGAVTANGGNVARGAVNVTANGGNVARGAVNVTANSRSGASAQNATVVRGYTGGRPNSSPPRGGGNHGRRPIISQRGCVNTGMC